MTIIYQHSDAGRRRGCCDGAADGCSKKNRRRRLGADSTFVVLCLVLTITIILQYSDILSDNVVTAARQQINRKLYKLSVQDAEYIYRQGYEDGRQNKAFSASYPDGFTYEVHVMQQANLQLQQPKDAEEWGAGQTLFGREDDDDDDDDDISSKDEENSSNGEGNQGSQREDKDAKESERQRRNRRKGRILFGLLPKRSLLRNLVFLGCSYYVIKTLHGLGRVTNHHVGSDRSDQKATSSACSWHWRAISQNLSTLDAWQVVIFLLSFWQVIQHLGLPAYLTILFDYEEDDDEF